MIRERELHLRLDANSAWSFEEARVFLSELTEQLRESPIHLDFVEDPCAEFEVWSRLKEEFPWIHFALDEALADPKIPEERLTVALQSCELLVVKPMALGGFSAALAWAERARLHELEICVSHFFEGPWGFDATCQLALAIQSSRFAPGLGPHLGLAALGEHKSQYLLPEGIIRAPQGDQSIS